MRLTYIERTLYVEDLNSKNGTFVKAGKKWQKIKGRRHITLPASLKVGSIVLLVDTQQPADLSEKQKKIFNSMIPTAGKEFK